MHKIQFDNFGNATIFGKYEDGLDLFNTLEDHDCSLIGDCTGKYGGLADLIYNAFFGCVYRLDNLDYQKALKGVPITLKAYDQSEFGVNVE
ncbi:MAG: hypothetical protein NC401_19735 [Ruminococcus sp.]|nr:hypothetical protein [Ruminococcus sp.]